MNIRRLKLKYLFVFMAVTFLGMGPVAEGEVFQAKADLLNSEGNSVGTVILEENPSGGVALQASLSNLPEGEHAFHIHGMA